jgi:hypothetical protein
VSPRRGWGRRLGWTSVLLGASALPLSLLADLLFGVEVTQIHRVNSPEEQAEQRRLRDPRDDPAEIYGVPLGGPRRVILVDRSDAFEPPEAPGRMLLRADPALGASPLTVEGLRLRAAVAAVVLVLVGAAVLALTRARAALPGGGGAGYAGPPGE